MQFKTSQVIRNLLSNALKVRDCCAWNHLLPLLPGASLSEPDLTPLQTTGSSQFTPDNGTVSVSACFVPAAEGDEENGGDKRESDVFSSRPPREKSKSFRPFGVRRAMSVLLIGEQVSFGAP